MKSAIFNKYIFIAQVKKQKKKKIIFDGTILKIDILKKIDGTSFKIILLYLYGWPINR
jgi:hypothetical protein